MRHAKLTQPAIIEHGQSNKTTALSLDDMLSSVTWAVPCRAGPPFTGAYGFRVSSTALETGSKQPSAGESSGSWGEAARCIGKLPL